MGGNYGTTMQTQTAVAQTVLKTAAADQLICRIWPPAMITLGLGLTAVWIGLLGYGLVRLTSPAIGVLLDFVAV